IHFDADVPATVVASFDAPCGTAATLWQFDDPALDFRGSRSTLRRGVVWDASIARFVAVGANGNGEVSEANDHGSAISSFVQHRREQRDQRPDPACEPRAEARM
ncbi:MAG: hypothetical protein H7Y62_01455, partial [Hyphomicrobium sp.]|nr:hypothetical protein [Hyphomicrobium sp.]